MTYGLSNREAGRVAGCSHVAIAKAIKSGHLPTLPGGKIDPAALEKWREGRRAPRGGNSRQVTTLPAPEVTTLPDQRPATVGPFAPVLAADGAHTNRAARIAAALADGTGEDLDPDAVGMLTARGTFATRADAELHRDSYVALMREIQFKREAAKVIEVDLVAQVVGESLARVRTRLMAIPAEQAPALHRCKTVGQLQDRLLEVITEALTELVTDAVAAAAKH
jgi:hypothetical protein